MTGLWSLIKRNCKLFFKDKGIFFTSLITPMILLVLYATFLARVYKESFLASMPQGFSVDESLINATVGGQLFSALLAVSCVTVAFCSNMLSVQDKVTGAVRDLRMTPVKKSTLALGYYISTLFSTLAICLIAMATGLIYIRNIGWYMTVGDILHLLLCVFLLTMFGTALSSIINVFLTSQGQISAVGTVVSAGYGFLCGAYMPISNFSKSLQRVLSFLPGTYGTSLLKNYALRGVFAEMSKSGFPSEVVNGIRDSLDCNIYFFENAVSITNMYIILGGTVAVLIAVYVLINALKRSKTK